MALAPLSRTVVLTEDGSTVRPSEMVRIPPRLIVKPPPVITTPADIYSDGTPQVGEQLTGIDPVATFATYGNRCWMRGETVLARTNAYTPTVAGEIDWMVDVIGADGVTILTSRTRITVAAISAPDPTINNTDEASTLDVSQVAGALNLFAEMDVIFAEIDAASDASEQQLADLDRRLDVLEN